MTHRHSIFVVLLFATSCIFGGGKEKNPNNENNQNNENNANNVVDMSANNENNQADMDPGEDMTPPPDDMTIPPDDMTMVDESYLPLDAVEQNCASPRTAWFTPTGDVQTAITQNSWVTTGAAPTDRVANGPYMGGRASVAYATKSGSNIGVYAAVVGGSDGDTQFVALSEAETNIDTSADLYAVALTPLAINRTAAEPVADIFSLLLATSEGVFNCVMTVDSSDATAMACGPSPWNQTVRDLDITQPARLDPAPIFGVFPNNNDYGLNLLGFDIIAAVSGPGASGETLGLLRAPRDGSAVSEVRIQGIETTLDGGTFGERLAFGVTDESFGFPILLTLHDDPTRGLQPAALRANNLSGSVVAPFGIGEWSLSSRLSPERGTFTFVDAYDIQTMFVLLGGLNGNVFTGIRFPPGDMQIGYAGLAADNQAVIFARPDKFAGGTVDFLEFELTNALEIVAFKNIPVFKPNASARSPIAVVHGANRNRLAVVDWGFGIDAKYVFNLLEPEFSNAQRLAANWWIDDAGTISMLAQRDFGNSTEWVVAAVAVEDLTDLSAACE